MTYFPQPNSTGIIDILRYTNVVTDNHFGELLMLSIFVMTYITMVRFGVERALTVSAFLTAVISYFLSIFGLINPQLIAIPTILVIISVLFLNKER